METIWVETSQQVDLRQKVASVGERFLAHALDYIFIGAYLLIFFGIFSVIGIVNAGTSILIMLPVVFYDLVLELAMNGQNLGKQIIGLRVVKLDGTTPSFFDYFIRWIFRLIDNIILFGGIATLTIILNGKGQRLGDLAAKTTVIRLKSRRPTADSLHDPQISPSYQPVFQGVDVFKESEIKTLKETLDFFVANPAEEKAVMLVRKAKEAAEKKLGIQSGLIPTEFLRTLIKDYYAHYQLRREQ
ncbi:MAG: RDD family protein [Bacteroidales bacterium]